MIGFNEDDVNLLTCPTCTEKLKWKGAKHPDGRLHYGVLMCDHNHTWRVESDIPNLVDRKQLSKKDQLMDVVYDFLAPVHDLSVTYLLPVLQYPDEDASRNTYIEAMALGCDDMSQGEEIKRILEVGVGTGANIPLLRNAARETKNLEIWAVDLNANMIRKCANANRSKDDSSLRLALADAHVLPFADSTFDRVLHVGGINIYRDAAQGMAEMARVAKADTPIVVVDEGLDKDRDNSIVHRMAFLWLTSMDEFTGAPEDLIPDNCEKVEVKAVSRFYYCLVFKKKTI